MRDVRTNYADWEKNERNILSAAQRQALLGILLSTLCDEVFPFSAERILRQGGTEYDIRLESELSFFSLNEEVALDEPDDDDSPESLTWEKEHSFAKECIMCFIDGLVKNEPITAQNFIDFCAALGFYDKSPIISNLCAQWSMQFDSRSKGDSSTLQWKLADLYGICSYLVNFPKEDRDEQREQENL